MPAYKKMYFHLFNRITDALQAMERQDFERAEAVLKQAQIEGEDMYIGEEPQENISLN